MKEFTISGYVRCSVCSNKITVDTNGRVTEHADRNNKDKICYGSKMPVLALQKENRPGELTYINVQK